MIVPVEVPQEITDLAQAIALCPVQVCEKVDPIMVRVVEGVKRRRQCLSLVQDAFSQLRLDVTYLIFDLEATRRERDEYHRQLEDAS